MTTMTNTPVSGVDYELITDSILAAATIQAASAQRDTSIEINHSYEHPDRHDATIAMLLTVKSRTLSNLRYRQTLFGIHTFLTG